MSSVTTFCCIFLIAACDMLKIDMFFHAVTSQLLVDGIATFNILDISGIAVFNCTLYETVHVFFQWCFQTCMCSEIHHCTADASSNLGFERDFMVSVVNER
jgi:hypothetical protein